MYIRKSYWWRSKLLFKARIKNSHWRQGTVLLTTDLCVFIVFIVFIVFTESLITIRDKIELGKIERTSWTCFGMSGCNEYGRKSLRSCNDSRFQFELLTMDLAGFPQNHIPVQPSGTGRLVPSVSLPSFIWNPTFNVANCPVTTYNRRSKTGNLVYFG